MSPDVETIGSLADWILVVVAAVTAFLALKNLREIRRQIEVPRIDRKIENFRNRIESENLFEVIKREKTCIVGNGPPVSTEDALVENYKNRSVKIFLPPEIIFHLKEFLMLAKTIDESEVITKKEKSDFIKESLFGISEFVYWLQIAKIAKNVSPNDSKIIEKVLAVMKPYPDLKLANRKSGEGLLSSNTKQDKDPPPNEPPLLAKASGLRSKDAGRDDLDRIPRACG
ncbi:MAG: hypothetical protein ACI4P6_06980 [Candidatus Spyradosoma sp.]